MRGFTAAETTLYLGPGRRTREVGVKGMLEDWCCCVVCGAWKFELEVRLAGKVRLGSKVELGQLTPPWKTTCHFSFRLSIYSIVYIPFTP